MRNIKITIEYDGKNFAGWQVQPGKESIQGAIQKALKEITGEDIEIYSSGRTDAGVHALNQVANFKTNSTIDTSKFAYALNSKLPNSIVVKSAEEVSERFHARYNCKEKTYKYIINNNEFPSALDRYREFHMPLKLVFEAMKEATSYFVGEHDFAGFKSSGGAPKKTTVRTIKKATITKSKDNRITIELTGDGFLYNMVRIISGTIVDVGLGRINVKDIPKIIESKDRKKAGKTLPPHGLYLVNVKY
jgi:tRNA pseudouridine38-40 synthase